MIGLDTGFFLDLLKGRHEAVDLWKAGLNDEVDLVVSCLSLFEIERLGLRGAIQGAEVIVESITGMCTVVWLDQDVLSRGARFSHGLGIPAVDSLILASLVSTGCTEIYTTDSHLESYKGAKVVVRIFVERDRPTGPCVWLSAAPPVVRCVGDSTVSLRRPSGVAPPRPALPVRPTSRPSCHSSLLRLHQHPFQKAVPQNQ